MPEPKFKKRLILNAIVSGAPRGNWTNPEDETREFTRSIESWIKLAQLAEKGKLNAIFVADHLTFFDDYKGPGNWEEPVKHGVFAPRIDPSATLAALATKTKSISFGITFSTVSEHPYHFARRLASLDHITKGRLGWNIVGSYLNSIGPQLLNGEPFPEHDERYVRSAEYLDVVYDLLLSSWRDDAIVYDKKNGIFADPSRIRKINHKGKYFNVEGPAITEPTKQRIPLIIQAGTSDRGKVFAAENAEVIFAFGQDDVLRQQIETIRSLAKEKFNRDPSAVKVIVGAHVVLGNTHEEALAKLENHKKYIDLEAESVAFGGVTGIDLSKYGWDEVVEYKKSNGLRTTVDNIYRDDKGKPVKGRTRRQIIETYANKAGTFVGTPQEVADQIEAKVERSDIDGFNLSLTNFPHDLEDIVELLVPELQKRGLFWDDYIVPGGTFRENVYGIKGHNYFPKNHPAYDLRWTEELDREEFDEKVKAHRQKLLEKREEAVLDVSKY